MTEEVLVRAFREDKDFIKTLKKFRREQDRLHAIIAFYRQATCT